MSMHPSNLKDCHSIDALRELSRKRLPGPIFHFMDGGAEAEVSLARNTAAFEDTRFVPQCLVDVTSIKTATRILGLELEWPVFCGPTGVSRFFHPEGEFAVVRAASKANTVFALSTNSTASLEAVAAAGNCPKLFQLYMFKDHGIGRELILRAKAAGYRALCLAVDVPVVGKRERDLRTGFGVPMRPSWDLLAGFAEHPFWLFGQILKGRVAIPHLEPWAKSRSLVAHTRFIASQLDASATWQDVSEIISLWNGPVVLKGIMRVDDARMAAAVGAAGVIVSNHGGRQLDGCAAPIDVLPHIVGAVGDKLDVILDGGVRRGTHILKALALGAKACSIGRPYLYGLAAGGEAGVSRALEILRTEFVRAMQLVGCTDVNDARRIELIGHKSVK